MNIDMNQNIRPSDIEFMTTYPKMGGHSEERVLFIVARTAEGYRYLIYASTIILKNVEMEQEIGYIDCCHAMTRSKVASIPMGRSLTINNEMYILPNDNETFFNVIFLDKQPARHVKKGDIEKLFGCVIDG